MIKEWECPVAWDEGVQSNVCANRDWKGEWVNCRDCYWYDKEDNNGKH